MHLLTVNVAKSWTECIFCYDFGWPLKSTSHDMYDILVLSHSVLPLLSPFILKFFSADVRYCPISLTVFDFLMDINEISGNIYIESLVWVYQIKIKEITFYQIILIYVYSSDGLSIYCRNTFNIMCTLMVYLQFHDLSSSAIVTFWEYQNFPWLKSMKIVILMCFTRFLLASTWFWCYW